MLPRVLRPEITQFKVAPTAPPRIDRTFQRLSLISKLLFLFRLKVKGVGVGVADVVVAAAVVGAAVVVVLLVPDAVPSVGWAAGTVFITACGSPTIRKMIKQ